MQVTNYEGKVIPFEGTKEEALQQGYNVDCFNCSDCSRCSYCSRCSDCSRCSRCSDCSDCSRCSRCSDCSDCSDCSRCSYCSRCSDCSDCSRCSDCSDCSDCSRCSRCSYCSEQPILNTPTDQHWTIILRKNATMSIGCQDHTISEWMNFDDHTISLMHGEAVAFWKQWKPIIQLIYQTFQVSTEESKQPQ